MATPVRSYTTSDGRIVQGHTRATAYDDEQAAIDQAAIDEREILVQSYRRRLPSKYGAPQTQTGVDEPYYKQKWGSLPATYEPEQYRPGRTTAGVLGSAAALGGGWLGLSGAIGEVQRLRGKPKFVNTTHNKRAALAGLGLAALGGAGLRYAFGRSRKEQAQYARADLSSAEFEALPRYRDARIQAASIGGLGSGLGAYALSRKFSKSARLNAIAGGIGLLGGAIGAGSIAARIIGRRRNAKLLRYPHEYGYSTLADFAVAPVSELRNKGGRSIKANGKSYVASKVERSTRPGKKYMVDVREVSTGRKKRVHFGAVGYSDYLQHKDKDRRRRFMARHKAIKLKDGSAAHKNPMQSAFWAVRSNW